MREDVAVGPDQRLGEAFDQAVDRLADLGRRLGAVRAVHRPVVSRLDRLTGAGPRCAGCGHPHPCPTLRAAGRPV